MTSCGLKTCRPSAFFLSGAFFQLLIFSAWSSEKPSLEEIPHPFFFHGGGLILVIIYAAPRRDLSQPAFNHGLPHQLDLLPSTCFCVHIRQDDVDAMVVGLEVEDPPDHPLRDVDVPLPPARRQQGPQHDDVGFPLHGADQVLGLGEPPAAAQEVDHAAAVLELRLHAVVPPHGQEDPTAGLE